MSCTELVSTFDNVMVRRENLPRLADAMDRIATTMHRQTYDGWVEDGGTYAEHAAALREIYGGAP